MNVKRCLLFAGNTSFSMYNFRLDVMIALQKEGYRIAVAAPRDEYSGLFAQHGIEYHELAMSRKGSNPFKEILTVKDFTALYRRVRPCLIFNFTIKPIIYGSFAAALCRIPSIAVTTGLGYAFVESNRFAPAACAARFLYRLALVFPREVWFLNISDRDIFIARRIAKSAKMRVIPGEGINTEHFAPRAQVLREGISFLLVSRLVADKGIFEYAEAARKVRRDFPGAQFNLLGQFDDYPNALTRDDVAQWEKEGLIRYLGTASDVRDHLAQCDCLVLPSRYREGVPRTLLEAAAMEKPLIATDIPGCRDVAADGVNGFLCRAGDAQDLERAMRRMISLDPEARAVMGRASRARVCDLFDVKIIARIYGETVRGMGL
ncbi:MAG: glycosyltransferase family 4 protein [Spirochaetota bacterium]